MSDTGTALGAAAPAPNDGDAAAPAAGTPPADGSTTATTVPGDAGTAGAPGADGTGGEGGGTAKPGAGETAKPNAPDAYELKLPEGATLADDDRAAFEQLCRELDLSQDTAQALLERQLDAQRQAREAAFAEMQSVQDAWRAAQARDKEFGGQALDANLATAVKALSRFGTPELVQLLNESRLGDHPEVVRAFYRIGKALEEDRFTPPAGEANGRKNVAERLYPNLSAA
jgi:hypothetical protein